MDHQRVEYSVERLCNKGCRAVREDIAALERGDLLVEVVNLNAQERAMVLRELQQIMAVYGDRCQIY